MIGRLYTSVFPFYDNKMHKMSYKSRPVLIVGQADQNDYAVLPVSRVTNQNNLDNYYDVLLEPADYPLANLTQKSYVRTHKQYTIHKGELVKDIVDFRNVYSDTYLDIIIKMEEFQKNLISKAI